ncbi:uncharacterized protein odam [Xenentodon cancila]
MRRQTQERVRSIRETDIMKLQTAVLLICLLRTSLALPVLIASNSNEVVNLNPQVAGPFGPQGPQLLLPNQGNQLTPVLLPNGQQEQLGPPQDPNNPNGPQQAQKPVQMYPQFQYPSFRFPQLQRQQSFSYFLPPYGYPQQRGTAVLQPNNGQQNLERTTQRPQRPLQVRQKQIPLKICFPASTEKTKSN